MIDPQRLDEPTRETIKIAMAYAEDRCHDSSVLCRPFSWDTILAVSSIVFHNKHNLYAHRFVFLSTARSTVVLIVSGNHRRSPCEAHLYRVYEAQAMAELIQNGLLPHQRRLLYQGANDLGKQKWIDMLEPYVVLDSMAGNNSE